jgi:hypothetical protein
MRRLILGQFYFGGANTFTSLGLMDIYLVKFNANGVYQAGKTYGNNSIDGLSATALDSQGNIYLVGSFYQTLNLDGISLVSNGSSDHFFAKLGSQVGIENQFSTDKKSIQIFQNRSGQWLVEGKKDGWLTGFQADGKEAFQLEILKDQPMEIKTHFQHGFYRFLKSDGKISLGRW